MMPSPAAPSTSAPSPAPRPNAPQFERAGFWVRAVAHAIDSMIVAVAYMPVQIFMTVSIFTRKAPTAGAAGAAAIAQQLGNSLGVIALFYVLHFCYHGFLVSRKGATWGKAAMGLRVIDVKIGRFPTFLKGGFRGSFGPMISCMPFMIGILMAAFRADKRALHDLLFSTIVIKIK